MQMPSKNGLFWPIPITLSTTEEIAKSIGMNEEVALIDSESQELVATMKVTEKYSIDKASSASRFSDQRRGAPGRAEGDGAGPDQLGRPG